MLLDFGDELARLLTFACFDLDLESVVDPRQAAFEGHVDDNALHLDDLPDVGRALL